MGDRHKEFSVALQLHRDRRRRNFQMSSDDPDLQRGAGCQSRGFPEGLRHDNAACRINGSFHGMNNTISYGKCQPLLYLLLISNLENVD